MAEMINFDSYLPIPLHQQNGFINKITSGNIDIRLSYCDQFQYVHIYKTQKTKNKQIYETEVIVKYFSLS